ncbi:MAG TPA: hypothetical protein DD640_01105 [Clostridiales bacterium]|nr:hypothetical protein [Clostridiales bacterium]
MLVNLILIAILILCALIGLKNGFLVMLGRLVLFIVAFAITLFLIGPLTDVLAEVPFLNSLAVKLTDGILKPLQLTSENIGTAIESFNLPPALARLMQSNLPTPDNSVTQAYPEFAAVLFKFALNAAVFVLMFVVASLAIHFIVRALTKVTDRAPGISAINRLGGMLAGLLLGTIQLAILLLTLGFLVPYLPALAEPLAESSIATFFYSINILSYLL